MLGLPPFWNWSPRAALPLVREALGCDLGICSAERLKAFYSHFSSLLPFAEVNMFIFPCLV